MIKDGVIDEGSLPDSEGIKGGNSVLDTIVALPGAIQKIDQLSREEIRAGEGRPLPRPFEKEMERGRRAMLL